MHIKQIIAVWILSIGTFSSMANVPSTLPSASPSTAQFSIQESTAQLIQLQDQIQSLESNLFQDQQSESMLNKNLAQLEIQMGNTLEILRQCQRQIKSISIERKQLKKQIEQLKLEQNSQAELLSDLLQHVYAHAKRERWSMLLSQEDIYSLPRLNHYYHAASSARKQEIQRIIEQLELSRTAQGKLLKTEQSLLALKAHSFENQVLLDSTQKTRQRILVQLKQKMNTQEYDLLQLKEEQNALETVLANLDINLPPKLEYVEPVLKFSSQKKHLRLPIQQNSALLTTIMSHASSAKKTYIKSSQGTPVHAIYHGKVVFSEWLRGIGLLLIIDHGNGYMSLYGNNEILYKSVGDSVENGDIISRVGQSGGQAEPGLYFELRKDGIALEPSEWFKLS